MKNNIASTERSVLDTLSYFNIFQHPLYADEILKFLKQPISINHLQSVLAEMVHDELIFQSGNLYSLSNNLEMFERRLKGAECAAKRMNEAHKAGRIISVFPFVKSVCISGSLSKGYADEKSDIDFFIITEKNRLWICRTLLHIFKKFTFLVNKQHSFCMNYFIDESMLCIEEQNIFTATEIATLLPVYNHQLHDKLLETNDKWVKDTLPNFKYNLSATATLDSRKHLTLLFEWLINLAAPKRLNEWLMKITDRRWRNKWEKKNYPMDEYHLAMKTKWYVSKQHPKNYQKQVLDKATTYKLRKCVPTT